MNIDEIIAITFIVGAVVGAFLEARYGKKAVAVVKAVEAEPAKLEAQVAEEVKKV